MASWPALVKLALEALGSWLKWMAYDAEIRTRTLKKDLPDKAGKDIDELEKEYWSLYNSGRFDDAERVRHKHSSLLIHLSTLPTFDPNPPQGTTGGDKGRGLCPTSGGNMDSSMALRGTGDGQLQSAKGAGEVQN